MIRPFQIVRLLQIYLVLLQHTFIRTVLKKEYGFFHFLSYLNPFSFYKRGRTRGEHIRIALESLGPIFVKFGQLLSTRRDLIADDLVDELSKLQDRVPPFSGTLAVKIIEKAFGKNIQELFLEFDVTPLASASVAQVHAATLHDGAQVIVKVIRPNIQKVIRHDIANLYFVARLVERYWKQAKRLHPVELVKEFEQTIIDEMDLLREAGNASQLRRNFQGSDKMYVPKVYWAYTRESVMVMERIYGIPIADIAALMQQHTNMKKLAEYGVEIFFTQVFRDSFFHADMHPGNLFVDTSNPNQPKYIGVDFGIMGTLSPADQRYLAENIYAFFNRDYRSVARLHVESGWVPADTRIDQFESAIRTVCEPIFERPLRDISFGLLLLRLFRTAERFNMEIQPQLMLLQKTLLSIEGLGRMLYPELDLWATAKPFMEKWMRERKGLCHLAKEFVEEWPKTSEKILKTPDLFFDVLQEMNIQQRLAKIVPAEPPTKKFRRARRRGFLLGAGIALLVVVIINFIINKQSTTQIVAEQWSAIAVALGLLIVGWIMPKD